VSPTRNSPHILALLLLLLPAAAPWCHSASDRYLRLLTDGPDLRARWDVALVDMDYAIGLDLDTAHRGLLRVSDGAQETTWVLSPTNRTLRIEFTAGEPKHPWGSFVDYWREGVWHIWIGFDHICFLVALLLPAALQREGSGWRPVSSLGRALGSIAGVVTAFTLAHSITLAMAALGWVELSSRWVESAIALTVLLAALNNLYPILPGRVWAIAFGLGLIHGFGFATALGGLELPATSLAIALAGFNLGVETGQLAIVAALVPLTYLARSSTWYRVGFLRAASAGIAGLACLWLAERSLGLAPMILLAG